MAAATPSAEAAPAPKKRGFRLPSAYTILFILIVVVAALTWVIPAGRYQYNDDGTPIPGSYQRVEQTPARIVVDSLTAPINGLYGIKGEDGSSPTTTAASCSARSTSRCSSWSSAGSWASR